MGVFLRIEFEFQDIFNCPHCGVRNIRAEIKEAFFKNAYGKFSTLGYWRNYHRYFVGICEECCQEILWQIEGKNKSNIKILYPKQPYHDFSSDMPEHVKSIYEEAVNVAELSPRAACALLRVALEKLLGYVGDSYEAFAQIKGKKLNEAIGILVDLGVSSRLQKALDVIRCRGNCAVHGGEIIMSDSLENVKELFEIMEIAIDELIVRTEKIQRNYDAMAETTKQAIKKRNQKN